MNSLSNGRGNFSSRSGNVQGTLGHGLRFLTATRGGSNRGPRATSTELASSGRLAPPPDRILGPRSPTIDSFGQGPVEGLRPALLVPIQNSVSAHWVGPIHGLDAGSIERRHEGENRSRKRRHRRASGKGAGPEHLCFPAARRHRGTRKKVSSASAAFSIPHWKAGLLPPSCSCRLALG